MRLSLPLAVALTSTAATVAAYSPFLVKPLSTHQPNGNPDGQVNYYNIAFTVSSLNGGNSTGECSTFWGDNGYTEQEAYSVNVPTGSWIECGASEFSFQLFPYFSIGNFTLAIQQNYTDLSTSQTIKANGSLHITNATSQYTCEILGDEATSFGQHARGDCSIPTDGSAFTIPVTAAAAVSECDSSANVNATFVATYDTTAGQNLLVVGSIPELGSWDPSSAILLSSADSSASWATFKGSVDIPAGTSFEYKYLLQDTDGGETWECCENRVYSLAADACGDVTAGNNPDYFRGGGDAVVF